MDLYNIFRLAFSITFIVEVVCSTTIPVYLLFYTILSVTHLINLELEMLFSLIALGISCLILLGGIGTFVRIRDKFIGLMGAEKDAFSTMTAAEKTVLVIWMVALFFFTTAGYYTLFLTYEHTIIPFIGSDLSVAVIYILIGIVIVCLIFQFITVILARFTRRIVKEVLDQEE